MEARYKQIRGLFGGKRGVIFRVPPYQRGYEWDERQWEDLWLDLNRINTHVDQHYLGSIILLEREAGEIYEIVDGQQRMVTLSIIMMAIRDSPQVEDPDDMRIDDIINTYPANESARKLELADDEADANYELIWEGESEQAEGQVKKAYQYYKDQIKNFDSDELHVLLDNVAKYLRVVETMAKDTSLAYTVFQSQNDRGKEVSPEILAKARIHGAAEDLEDEVAQREVTGRWDHIYNLLRKNLDTPRFQEALRVRRPMTQILINSHVPTPTQIDKGALYREFEKVLDQYDSVTDFVEWFQDQVDIYLEISSNRYDISGRGIPDDAIRHLQYLNSASTHSEVLSLSIYNSINDDISLRENFRLASVLAMRMEMGGSSSASTRDAIYTTARDVRREEDPAEIRKVIRDAIKSKTPSDAEILEHLKANQMTIRGQWNFRTLLKLVSIEEERRGPLRMELPNLDIEHIAPRNTFGNTKYADWRRKLDEEEFEDRKDKLGNLTLLLPNDHSSLDETSFESKKHTYTNSDVKIAEEVAKYDEWDDEQIERRNERLAKELISRWSI
ncbi:DUF262 domain-containing protein [Halorubrum ezzemoulense]|uniref:DUF262 domain-containing protein n=1 Tax=Halorubrum ezzemoulense TaxID=337243 RepID=UPI00232D32EC|nr:DUF262 domain-containing HNH endonuclease family protein [Halorubrum ezzemoulense]MDB2243006.1 DUF262 domain-containing HNH endonuclease family protein [Halorubrum ezzemoulense]